MIVVRANQPDKKYNQRTDDFITEYKIGGITFFSGDIGEQLQATKRWQNLSKIPLFVTIDAEWGLGMRMKELPPYPFQMTLGACDQDTLFYLMGLEIAHACRRLGINMNFAPVVDVNSNPDNPIIHMRSFGEDPEAVGQKGAAYMKGMRDGGILTVAKHFPGHGDTDTDSHYTLPVIKHSKHRLDSIELKPFKRLIREGVDGIMIAHLNLPEYNPDKDLASTLSEDIVNGLLRNELGFEGLIITDALDMKGVTAYHKSGEIELLAFKAGNDILLLPENVPRAVESLKKAVEQGEISQNELDHRCRRILNYSFTERK